MAHFETKHWIIIIVVAMILLYGYFSDIEISGTLKLAGGVSRTIISPSLVNTQPTIKLTITPTGSETFLIEETSPLDIISTSVPEGCSLSSTKTLKCNFFSITTTKILNYKVNANTIGTYTFSGVYGLGSGGSKQTIGGNTQLQIISCSPTTEICDNIDNDCDNSIDEGLTQSQNCGACSKGTQSKTCSNGVWGSFSNCINEPTQKTLADLNCDNNICFDEILSYVQKWVSGTVIFDDALSAVQSWTAQTTSC